MYRGGRLAPWFSTQHNRRFLERAAKAGGGRMTELTAMNTPIDTSHLRRSWREKPVLLFTKNGLPAASSGVFTEVEYAPYVEHGTGLWGPKHAKYVIEPKNPDGWLRWTDPHTGLPVFAKRVLHPGSPGNHMVAIAANVTEHELGLIVQPALERWAREVERQNHTGLGTGRHA